MLPDSTLLAVGSLSFSIQKPFTGVEVRGALEVVLQSTTVPIMHCRTEPACAVERALWRDAEFGIEGTLKRT